MAIAAKKGRKIPKAILAAHVTLAVACYGTPGYFTLNPHASLL